MRHALLAISIGFAAPAIANETSDAILDSWRAWADEYGITETSIAVGKSGEIIATDRINRQSDVGYPIMSLSKAITAVCLSDVLAKTNYSFETRCHIP